MSRQEALRSLRGDIIETYLSNGMSTIGVYEQFVDGIDLGLFDNRKMKFKEFVEGVTYDAIYTKILIHKNHI